ncbi:MAG: glucuronoarabinoxylan endo,4-beta-xylanase [Chloroflexota bacterium]|nr:glucuronoarabinoxylan endo,4-beta-xylanase [Chloroflexota bacterium]
MRGTLLVVAALIPLAPGSKSAAGDEPAGTLEVRVERPRDRQVIDGFGGSLAYWGYNADETALRCALDELGATIVRIPAEVTQAGDPDAYRDALRRVAKVAPEAKVYLSFWQPRSKEKTRPEDWLDLDASGKYRLKPAMAGAWADEMVARVAAIRRDWGANVVAVGVQNEPDFSQPGTLTCAWEPDKLAEFTAYEFAPRLAAAGLGLLPIAAPELASSHDDAEQAKRFAPVLAGPAVAIFSYHMYDSYKDGEANPGLDRMRARQKAVGRFLRERLPTKRVWMTETTGAQWNVPEWHTLGWDASLDEHDKAVALARYMHATLVDAGAGAFLWWGLIYSAPPASKTDDRERQKFRDEGLILVEPEARDGVHPFRERTPKSYTFQQFAKFIRPGWVRLDVPEPEGTGAPLVAAFRNEDGRKVAVVLINPDKATPRAIEPRVTGVGAFRLDRAYVTDRRRRCEPTEWQGTLPTESVATLLYVAD